jgi:predicted dienelactone hydrolase
MVRSLRGRRAAVVGVSCSAVFALSSTTLASCAPPASSREALPFAPAGKDAAPDPSQEGPYPVGVRHYTLVDDFRIEENGPNAGKPRTLPLEVWYPAVEAARDAAKETIYLFNELPPDLQEGLTIDDLGELPTIAVRDADVRHDDDDTYPLVVFSHGKGGTRLQSNFYTAYLASHGYVVVAPDHSGDTIVELLREVKASGNIQADSTVEALVYRPADIIAILDLLPDVIDDELNARVDYDHVGVSGHSFGAITSFISASEDNRIDAIVPQCPGSQDLLGLQMRTPLADMQIPMLIQSASQDGTLPEDTNAKPLYEHMPTPKSWLSMTRAGHFTYSDLCVLDVEAINAAIDLDVSNVLDDGCGPEAVPTDVAFPVIRSSAIGFFNEHLRGSTGSAKYLSQDDVDRLAPGEGTFSHDE